MDRSNVIKKVENLHLKDPYKQVEKKISDFYTELDEQEREELGEELEELSKNIPSKEIPDYGLKERALDFISKGKRYYVWAGTAIVGMGGVLACAFTGNSDLFLPSYGTILASLPGLWAGSGRRKHFDSYKARKLIDLPGSTFKDLTREYSF